MYGRFARIISRAKVSLLTELDVMEWQDGALIFLSIF